MGGGGAGPFSREDRFSAPSDSFFVTYQQKQQSSYFQQKLVQLAFYKAQS
jgi:hypothetical protein